MFDSSMTGSDVLGNIVENRVLQETLFSKLLELQGSHRSSFTHSSQLLH